MKIEQRQIVDDRKRKTIVSEKKIQMTKTDSHKVLSSFQLKWVRYVNIILNKYILKHTQQKKKKKQGL